MRRLAPLLLSLTLFPVAACRRFPDQPAVARRVLVGGAERYVDLPATLEAVRARGGEVRTVEEAGVTVQRATLGTPPSYQATFSATGELERARLVDGASVRYVERVRSPRLQRQFLVVTREATLGTDGQEGVSRRVSLLAQVDLLPSYLGALVEDQAHKPHRKGSLGEAMAHRELKARATLDEMRRVLPPEDYARVLDVFADSPYLEETVRAAVRESK